MSTHLGPSPMHGGLTEHVGPAEDCTYPDCAERNFPPRDARGRYMPYARRPLVPVVLRWECRCGTVTTPDADSIRAHIETAHSEESQR